MARRDRDAPVLHAENVDNHAVGEVVVAVHEFHSHPLAVARQTVVLVGDHEVAVHLLEEVVPEGRSVGETSREGSEKRTF